MSGVEFLPSLLPTLGLGAGVAGATALATRPPKLPEPAPTPRMPDLESPTVLEARRRRVAQTQAGSGRESTILADDTYSNSLLGQ